MLRIHQPHENPVLSASSTSTRNRTVRTGTIQDLPYLTDLQSRWSQNVGFLPRCVLERYLERQQVYLVAENTQHAGYLLWTFRPDGLVRVLQVAIEPELLRTTLGSKVMRSLERRAIASNCSIIRLKSRSDLPANQFWPLFGFKPTAIVARPSNRGLPLIEWTLQLLDPATIALALATNGRPFRKGRLEPPTPPRLP